MSKQRPSDLPVEASASKRANARTESQGYWQKRVFKNTYTRAGRCLEVKRWSVKIQHQGTRRTFSLVEKSRAAAAIEAQAIHQTITTRGWDAAPAVALKTVVPSRSRAASESETLPKTDVRYWKRRLLQRRHSSSAISMTGGEFSARIEHAGVSHYLPLGTLNEDSAAVRARDIYLAVVKDGWEAVNRRFSRELTLAIHWADNPLAWTYATLHTIVDAATVHASPASPKSNTHFNAVVVEPDDSTRRALARCIDSQGGCFLCVSAFASAKDALREIPRSSPRLALVNRALPDCTDGEFADKFRRIAPGLPLLFFATYEDSDQLFKATPGGASGYLLKRTSPEALFDPIADAPTDDPLSAERIALHVRRYFQNIVLSLSSDESAPDMAKLTQREHEILNLLSKGYVDKEIAEVLGISVWTVHGHLKKVFEKLGVHTRTEAAIKYLHK